jgi:hypothetical protein
MDFWRIGTFSIHEKQETDRKKTHHGKDPHIKTHLQSTP